MKRYSGPICSAYKCSNKVDAYKIIKERQFGFCNKHINLLDNGSTMTLLEIISSTKQDILALKDMINFNNIGYSEKEFFDTIDYLFSIGELSHNGSIIITREDSGSCEFYGCKLKKIQGNIYCSNHKNLPNMEKIDMILDCIRLSPKTSKEISSMCNIKPNKLKASLYQLIKFGYVFKEKRGVTNYYMCR